MPGMRFGFEYDESDGDGDRGSRSGDRIGGAVSSGVGQRDCVGTPRSASGGNSASAKVEMMMIMMDLRCAADLYSFGTSTLQVELLWYILT